MIQKHKFFDIFRQNPDGSLTPKKVIQVGAVTFGPGIYFGRGVNFGGIDFFQYLNNEVATEEKDGILIIKGFYTK
jgi:hypothetical protein